MKATDIRKGHVLMIDGQPCRVMDFTHRTPGNLRAFVQVRFRSLVSGNTFDQRLAATDFLQEARLDTKEMQVLYQDQGGVHVMDQQTYEQFTLDERAVGEDTPWLQPEMVVQVEWLDGRPIAIELPSVIELKVVETSPVMKTATKTASTKPAKLSNGVTVQVPEFISRGESLAPPKPCSSLSILSSQPVARAVSSRRSPWACRRRIARETDRMTHLRPSLS